MSFTWDYGRSLKTINKTGLSATYYYNQDGIRNGKTVNGVGINYYLDNENRIISQSNGATKLNFFYDEKGELFGFNKMASNGYIEKYFYVRNAQGDIIEIINEEGASVCKYVYDTWGNVTSITGIYADSLAVENPFRYRGYYYDNESGLYYLQSRYYDPTTGRFLNADVFLDTGISVLSTNMFAYCENNSVMFVDPTGHAYDRIKANQWATNYWNGTADTWKRNDSDCANFVSQCLLNGGIQMDNIWYAKLYLKIRRDYSDAWGKAKKLYDWLISKKDLYSSTVVLRNTTDLKNAIANGTICAGDPAFIDTDYMGTDANHGNLSHAVLLGSINSIREDMFYYSHTTDRNGKNGYDSKKIDSRGLKYYFDHKPIGKFAMVFVIHMK